MAVNVPPWPLDEFRPYLLLLAKSGVDGRVRRHLDASDVVQEALLKAHAHLHEFRGTTKGELAAWLRQILARTLANLLRDLHRTRRGGLRNGTLELALEDSSARLESWLADDQLTPATAFERQEWALRLADVMVGLAEAEQEALLLRYWQGWKLKEIAGQLDLSTSATAELLDRALKKLRSRLGSFREP